MDYSAEECQNSFTQGQIDLMRGVLENQRYDLVHDNPASVEIEELASSIYPNPVTSELNVSFDNGIASSVEIYGMNGRLIQSHQPESSVLTMDVNAMESGVYLVHIKSNSGHTSVKKFVKQ